MDGAAPAPTGPLVIDVSPNLDVAEHYFLDNPTLLNKIASCLQGVDTNLIIDDSTKNRMMAVKTHLTRHLDRKLLPFEEHI